MKPRAGAKTHAHARQSNSDSISRLSKRIAAISTCGATAVTRAISGGSKVDSSASRMPMVNRRTVAAGSKCGVSCKVRAKDCRAVRTSAASERASGVGAMP
ncbi:hypothetical protein OR16_05007 [Cupriavidus basilensis OR16]|uniref:Uncharacterized protein n=1 Tax=Cupriavidus basilensis OR16 TaxID=1127483 RepID=H1S084_9BURK|nr:hypothetical protein OR16_05007 [Cupriavidus basilensis OR16]